MSVSGTIILNTFLILDMFDMSRDGIKHQNIRDFLLEKEWK